MSYPEIPEDATLSESRPVRLYQVDAVVIEELHKVIAKRTRIGLHDIIRDAIHAGLPAVLKRWEPMMNNDTTKK